MKELSAENRVALQKLITDSQDLRKMLKERGWEVLKSKIEARITDKHKVWLKAKSSEAAEILRHKTSGYEGIFDIKNKILLEGQNAQQILDKNPNIS